MPETPADTVSNLLQDYYMFFLIGGVAVTAVATGVIRMVMKRKRNRENAGPKQ